MSEEKTPNERSEQTVIKEAAKSTLNNLIKSWLDFKIFLKQRRQLLENPTLALSNTAKDEPDWKSPFAFATQGLLLTTVLVHLIASGFGLFLVRPKPYIKRFHDREIELTLRENLAIAEQADEHTVFKTYVSITPTDRVKNLLRKPETAKYGINKGDYVTEMRTLIVQAGEDYKNNSKVIDFSEKFDSAEATLSKILVPLSLILAAVFFRFLFYRTKEGRVAANKDRVLEVHLYLVTAHLFWMNAAMAVIYAALDNAIIYSGYYDSMMFDSIINGDGASTELFFFQVKTAITFILSFPLILYSSYKLSSSMRKVFGLQHSRQSILYGGVGSQVRVANFLSIIITSFVLLIFSLGYAMLVTKLEQLRFNPENSNQTALIITRQPKHWGKTVK